MTPTPNFGIRNKTFWTKAVQIPKGTIGPVADNKISWATQNRALTFRATQRASNAKLNPESELWV